MIGDFFGFILRHIEKKPASDSPIVLDGLEQFLFLLFSHARQDLNLAFAS